MKANAALYERSFSHLKKSNSASHAVLALVVVDGQHTSIKAINYIVRSNERHSEVRGTRINKERYQTPTCSDSETSKDGEDCSNSVRSRLIA